MIYAALLRGINVGGNHRVEMPKLKQLFEDLGFNNVSTYINSGNVIFSSLMEDKTKLCRKIEPALQEKFGFEIPIILRSSIDIEKTVAGIPANWTNDSSMKCDVMFLWPSLEGPEIMKQVPEANDFEDFIYVPGALVWRVDRDRVIPGVGPKLIGTNIYKQMTMRNINTVRKIYEKMTG